MKLVNEIKEIIKEKFDIEFDASFTEADKDSLFEYITTTIYEEFSDIGLEETNSEGVRKYHEDVHSYIHEEYINLLEENFIEYFGETFGDLEECWNDYIDDTLVNNDSLSYPYLYGDIDELLETQDIEDIALCIAKSLADSFEEKINAEKSSLFNSIDKYDPAFANNFTTLFDLDYYLNPNYIADKENE